MPDALEDTTFIITVDFPPSSRNEPRYTANNTNGYVDRILGAGINSYRETLTSFSRFFEKLSGIDAYDSGDPGAPHYINPFLPGLDCVSLYCLLAIHNPRLYVEVGSGNSTKFARRSITDNGLRTRIISIDPNPRAQIDELSDTVIRMPLEDVDLSLFSQLEENDVLFVDNSHRCFTNSDVTVCFIDIMPALKNGVFLHLHDIFWPLDYPAEWGNRYYNEQYLLGALLANGMPGYEIVLPNYYVSLNAHLREIVAPLWASREEKFRKVERHGCSFWMRRKGI